LQLANAIVGGVTRTVTDDGNLGNITAISGKLANLTYDAFNRLVSLKDPLRPNGTNPSDFYSYDPAGLRYARTETATDGSKSTTYYLYEGNSILYEETWKNGARTRSAFNLYLGGQNIGRYIQSGGTESLQYFYNDHLGSRRAVTNSAGVVQAKIDYSVWGVPTVTNYNGYDGSQDISYTGKEYDATKLYYFNARYYDPSIGRFLTEDPARDEINWYAYCGNNPLSSTDPTGLRQIIDDDENGRPITVSPREEYEAKTIGRLLRQESNRGDPSPTDIEQLRADRASGLIRDGVTREYSSAGTPDCDVRAHNTAVQNGISPNTATGASWDPNKLTVPQEFRIVANEASRIPVPGTAGFAYTDETRDGVKDHVIYYEYSGGKTYTAWKYAGDGSASSVREWSLFTDYYNETMMEFVPMGVLK